MLREVAFMNNGEDIRRQIKQTSIALGHDGFLYLYIQDGRIRAVGDLSVSVLTPLLVSVLSKSISKDKE